MVYKNTILHSIAMQIEVNTNFMLKYNSLLSELIAYLYYAK